MKIALMPGRDKHANNIAVKVGYFLREHDVETYYTNVERVSAQDQETIVQEADYCLALQCLESKGVPLIQIIHEDQAVLDTMSETIKSNTRYRLETEQEDGVEDILFFVHYATSDLTPTANRSEKLVDHGLMNLASAIAKGIKGGVVNEVGEYCPICLKGPFKALHVHMRIHEGEIPPQGVDTE